MSKKKEPTVSHPSNEERLDPTVFKIDEPVGRAEFVEDSKLCNLAWSIYKNGQLQPIYSTPDHEVIFGINRIKAVQKLREGFPHDGVVVKDENATVWTVVVTGATEKDRFLTALAENNDRNATTDYDDAVNQHKLRHTFKFNETEIAKIYGYGNVNRISQLREAYEALSPSVWKKVHAGSLSLDAACRLYKYLPAGKEDPGIWDEALRNAKDPESGKYDGGKINDFIRTEQEGVAPDTTPTPEKKKEDKVPAVPKLARNFTHVKKWFTAIVEAPDESTPTQVAFAETFLLWLEGKKSDRQLDNKFSEVKS